MIYLRLNFRGFVGRFVMAIFKTGNGESKNKHGEREWGTGMGNGNGEREWGTGNRNGERGFFKIRNL